MIYRLLNNIITINITSHITDHLISQKDFSVHRIFLILRNILFINKVTTKDYSIKEFY